MPKRLMMTKFYRCCFSFFNYKDSSMYFIGDYVMYIICKINLCIHKHEANAPRISISYSFYHLSAKTCLYCLLQLISIYALLLHNIPPLTCHVCNLVRRISKENNEFLFCVMVSSIKIALISLSYQE